MKGLILIMDGMGDRPIIALLLGGYFAYIMFDGTVNADSYKDENGFVRAKAFQVGVFSRVENANRVAKLNNGIVVQEDDMYRVYIGVLSKDAAINNLKKFYDLYSPYHCALELFQFAHNKMQMAYLLIASYFDE